MASSPAAAPAASSPAPAASIEPQGFLDSLKEDLIAGLYREAAARTNIHAKELLISAFGGTEQQRAAWAIVLDTPAGVWMLALLGAQVLGEIEKRGVPPEHRPAVDRFRKEMRVEGARGVIAQVIDKVVVPLGGFVLEQVKNLTAMAALSIGAGASSSSPAEAPRLASVARLPSFSDEAHAKESTGR